MDLSDIGRDAKRLMPGEYSHMSDEEAGQAWISVYPGQLPEQFFPKKELEVSRFIPDAAFAPYPAPPTPAPQHGFTPSYQRFAPEYHFFAKWGSAHEHYQNANIEAQFEREDKLRHGLDRYEMEFHKQVGEHNRAEQVADLGLVKSRFDQEIELRERGFRHQIFMFLANEAARRGLSPDVFISIRNSEATNAESLRVTRENNNEDIRHKRELQNLELDKTRQQKEMEIAAAMKVDALDRERVVFLQDAILELMEKQHVIQTSGKDPALVSRQVALMGKTIAGLENMLDGLI